MVMSKSKGKAAPAPVRKVKKVEKPIEEVEEVIEEVSDEEEIEEEAEQEEFFEDDIEVGTEILMHFKKNKGGHFWLDKNKKIGADESFWWAKDAIPKSFSDLISTVEDTKIKSHRKYLGTGVFGIEEVIGGWVIVNTEFDKEVSEKLNKKDASRICSELNA